MPREPACSAMAGAAGFIPRGLKAAARNGAPGWPVMLFAGLLVIVGLLGLDRWVYEHVSLMLNTEDRPLDRDFYSLTKPFWLGCRYAFGHVLGGLVIYGLVVLLHPRRWSAASVGLVAVVLAAGAANLAQHAIGRLRPNQAPSHLAFTQPALGLRHSEHVSFPSGEAATAFALACVLTRQFPRWTTVFFAGALLAAGARLVNGAHYLSDVGAGSLLGVFVANVVLRAADRYLSAQRTVQPPGAFSVKEETPTRCTDAPGAPGPARDRGD